MKNKHPGQKNAGKVKKKREQRVQKTDFTGRREYKWWGGVAARQTCQDWCMGLLSTTTKRIIKNTETTCQCVSVWAHEEQNQWASESPSHARRSVPCMEQVCANVWQTMTTEMWCLKVRFGGKGRAAQQEAGAITAQQSRALSSALCNITSMSLKIKALKITTTSVSGLLCCAGFWRAAASVEITQRCES